MQFLHLHYLDVHLKRVLISANFSDCAMIDINIACKHNLMQDVNNECIQLMYDAYAGVVC